MEPTILKDLKSKDYTTLCGTFCGITSIIFSIEYWQPWYSCLFIFLAAFFDLMDGFVARKKKEANEIGKELDSLSDSLCFGVAPAILVFTTYTKEELWSYTNFDSSGYSGIPFYIMLFPCAIFIFGAIIRLAWFNIDEGEGYTGLVTPQSGLVMMLLVMADFAWYSSDSLGWTLDYSPIMMYINFFILILAAYFNICPYLVYGKNIRKKTGSLKYIMIFMGILIISAIIMGIFFRVSASFIIELFSFIVVGIIIGNIVYGFRNWYKYERIKN